MAHNETVHIAHAGFPGGMVINKSEFDATAMELFRKDAAPVASQSSTGIEDMQVAEPVLDAPTGQPKATQRGAKPKGAKPEASKVEPEGV